MTPVPVQHETRVRGYLADADSFLVVAEDGEDLPADRRPASRLWGFQLWTHADNRRAQSLYEGLGFRRSGREKDDDLGEAIVHYQLSR